MNYPVWDFPFLGSGLVVALIATFHILVSHMAIGGGAFLFGAELWALREGPRAQPLRRWLKKFTTWFLITTTVLGAMTGVGIWFAIQLANPEATSLLIHQFVFVWALEWILFVGEMTFIFYYYYAWERNTGRMPVFLAAMYFIIAWGSLFAINGILTFMLTPDGWTLANKDIFAAFFNPTFWPSLFLRTFVMFMLAGIFGIFIASQLTDENEDDAGLKESVIHFSLKWVIPAGLLLPIFGAWYWFALPETTVKLVQGGMVGLSGGRLEMISRFLLLGGVSVAMILAIVTVMGLKARLVNTASAIALVLVAQFAIAGGEFFREMARKPYVLYGTLYSNSVWKANAENPAWRGRSMFANARWMGNTQPMTLDHGEAVFRLQCASCHTRDGYRSIKQRTSLWTPESGFKWLPTMADQGVMPPFVGDANDRAALVSYLLTLNGTKVQPSEVLAKGLAAETLAVAPAAAPTPATAPASAQGGAK